MNKLYTLKKNARIKRTPKHSSKTIVYLMAGDIVEMVEPGKRYDYITFNNEYGFIRTSALIK